MPTGRTLNHGTRTSNADPTPVREEDFRSTADLIAETRADLRRTMAEIDQHLGENEWHKRRTNLLFVIVAVLVVLFAVAVWFAYPVWRGREDQNQSSGLTQSRVPELESKQRESNERLTQLQEQVAALQREIAVIREEASAATGKTKEPNDTKQTSGRESSGLNERAVTNQTAPNTPANRVDRKRIDFEVSNRQAKEIAPGLYLTLGSADAGKQEVDATLKLGDDAGYVTIRSQGIRKSVLFHLPDDRRPIELVFTQILRNGASGYLMMPVPPIAASH
jgi:flagellar basal body-associated protein FliL